jgi:hypothetical protein
MGRNKNYPSAVYQLFSGSRQVAVRFVLSIPNMSTRASSFEKKNATQTCTFRVNTNERPFSRTCCSAVGNARVMAIMKVAIVINDCLHQVDE